jgi:hypothetical protein
VEIISRACNNLDIEVKVSSESEKLLDEQVIREVMSDHPVELRGRVHLLQVILQLLKDQARLRALQHHALVVAVNDAAVILADRVDNENK